MPVYLGNEIILVQLGSTEAWLCSHKCYAEVGTPEWFWDDRFDCIKTV